MGEAESDLRQRIEGAGLAERVDALLGVAAPSIRLRTRPTGERVLVRAPAAIWGVERAVAIAGSHHCLALRDDGTVLAWGENRAGQLGDGTTKLRRSPVAVAGLTDVVAVSAGGAHSLALTSSGAVVAWGNNEVGQLGDGTRTSRSTPTPVAGLERDVVAIVAGNGRSLALLTDGSAVAWGLNAVGEIGLDHVRSSPCPVPGLERDIVAIAAGGSHDLALTSAGAVLAWGMSNTAGLGVFNVFDPSRPPHLVHPAVVPGLPAGIRMIAAGEDHNLVINSDDRVFAWGRGVLGELGDGRRENSFPPVSVPVPTPVRAVAAGAAWSYAIGDDGALLSWGWNDQGCLGDGTTDDRSTPQPVPALLDGVAAVSAQLALMVDGSVMAWGGEFPADERGRDTDLDIGVSKLGGRPDLSPGSHWPTRSGRPLAFVAQVNLADVTSLDPTGLLPRAGLLSFFHGASDSAEDHCAVILSDPGTSLTRRRFPAALGDAERYGAVPVTAEAQLTLPPDPPGWLTDEERAAHENEMYTIGDGRDHRLLGHPSPVQGDPRDGRVLLLQIDSDDDARMAWGDAGRLYYLIECEDLRARQFSAACCELQSH